MLCVRSALIAVGLLLLLGVDRHQNVAGAYFTNRLLDPSFESATKDDEVQPGATPPASATSTAWTVTIRRSLWAVDRSQPVPITCNDQTGGRTGRCSLSPLAGDGTHENQLLFISQYVPVTKVTERSRDFESDLKCDGGPLLIDFWTRVIATTPDVETTSDLHLRVDVSYTHAGRHLTVRVTPKQIGAAAADNEFVRTCVIVPDYGQVRALMTSFVVGDKIRKSLPGNRLHIDDVSVGFIGTNAQVEEALAAGCQPYVDSFPRSRHVVADFLSPVGSSDDGETPPVTLATQLTADRLPALERAASIWRAPVSATLMLYDDDVTSSILRNITVAYYRSAILRSFVSLHVVYEDVVNRKQKRHATPREGEGGNDNDDDRTRYPINFLRNVAIAHVPTSHVFYVDVDLMTTFSAPDLQRWIADASDDLRLTNDERVKTAFLVPVFSYASSAVTTANVDVADLPKSKADLLRRLKLSPGAVGKLEPLAYSSHSVVDYGRWYVADKAYYVSYREDMEPYLVVQSTSPVMSDIYAGYGRDKCAYSRDLDRAGFRFVVLPTAFLMYVADAVASPTVYARSGGVRPEMFFSVEFHRHDLQAGHFWSPSDFDFRRRREPIATCLRDVDISGVSDDASSCRRDAEDEEWRNYEE